MNIVKTFSILLLGAAALHADNPRYGLQAGVSFPNNTLSDEANLGFQFGGHADWDFGRGHGLMARADVDLYGSKDSFSTSSFGAGADYTYHFNQNTLGPYVLAGVAFVNFSTSRYGSSVTNNGLGLDLGVGYDLNHHVGFQVRYQTHSVNAGTYSAVNLGVLYTW